MLLWLANEGVEAGAHEGGLVSHHTMLYFQSTAFVLAIIVVTVLIGRGKLGVVPRGWAAVYEHIWDWLDGMSCELMGPEGRNYTPFAMTLFLFVLVSNWSGLLPIPTFGDGEAWQYEAPSTSYNTTLALALISFLAFNYYGLKKRIFPPQAEPAAESHAHDDHGHEDEHHHANPGGLQGLMVWIGHFWQPTPMLWRELEGGLRYALVPLLGILFIGLNIVEELARIMSLSIRLYGNISGEHVVKTNLMSTMWGFLTTMLTGLQAGNLASLGLGVMFFLLWGASIFATCLGGLAGFIQAMIFAVLSLSYIGHAVADEH